MVNKQQQPKKPLGFLTGLDAKTAEMLRTFGYDVTYNIKFIKDCDFVVFVDAEPAITPFLYGHNRMKGARPTNARLDKRENRIYRMIPDDVPKIGFGRGALFLNIMNGGASYQMVDGHDTGHHAVQILHDEGFKRVTSRRVMMAPTKHTEMMMPSRACSYVLMGSAASCSVRYVEDRKIDINNNAGMSFTDPEILYYYESTSLCVQPLVSECSPSEPMRFYFRKLLRTIMNTALGVPSATSSSTPTEVITN